MLNSISETKKKLYIYTYKNQNLFKLRKHANTMNIFYKMLTFKIVLEIKMKHVYVLTLFPIINKNSPFFF
jgi:hypothetical protein